MGHVFKMRPDETTAIALNWMPQGRRNQERPRWDVETHQRKTTT